MDLTNLSTQHLVLLSLVAITILTIFSLLLPIAEIAKTITLDLANADPDETYTVQFFNKDGNLIGTKQVSGAKGALTFSLPDGAVTATVTDSHGRRWTSSTLDTTSLNDITWNLTTPVNPKPLFSLGFVDISENGALILPPELQVQPGNAVYTDTCCTTLDTYPCQDTTCAEVDCNLGDYLGQEASVFDQLAECLVYDISTTNTLSSVCSSYTMSMPSLCYNGASYEFDVPLGEYLSGCESADYSVSTTAVGDCSVGSPTTKTVISGERNSLGVSVAITSGDYCEVTLTLQDPAGEAYSSRLVLYGGSENYYCLSERPLYCSFSPRGDLNNDGEITEEDADSLAELVNNGNAEVNDYTDYNGDGVVDRDDLICVTALLANELSDYALLGCPVLTGGPLENCGLCGCQEGYVCSDNTCVVGAPSNVKDLSKYSSKGAFLVSDKNWRTVLPLIPVSTWTGSERNCQRGYGTPNDVCVYPTLIYHEEDSSFDADSVIHFMQQYKPTNLVIAGDIPQKLYGLLLAQPKGGGGLTEFSMQKISPADYLGFWSSYKDIVYVKDDYETALMAATYASLLDAPLVIQGTHSDQEGTFAGRHVICVGVDGRCDETYTLDDLQKKYLALTGTNKLMLVNPNDINFYVDTPLKTTLSVGTVNQIYSKTSLASPALAAAKHELLVFYDRVNYSIEPDAYCENTNIDVILADVAAVLKSKVKSLFPDQSIVVSQSGSVVIVSTPVEYLTILASPNAIPDSVHYEGGLCHRPPEFALQGQRLASDRKLLPGSKTGRIYSLTVSDVSSYVARSLFYDYLFSELYGDAHTGLLVNTVIVAGNPEEITMSDSIIINNLLTQNGYNISCIWVGIGAGSNGPLPTCQTFPTLGGEWLQTNAWKNKQFIINFGHGGPNVWGGILWSKNIPELDLPYVHAFSCSTAYFWPSTDSPDRSLRFAPTLIRKGAMAYHGLVGMGSSSAEACPYCIPHNAMVALGKLVTDSEITLGGLDLYLSHETAEYVEQGFNFFTLLGDPTLRMNFKMVSQWAAAQEGTPPTGLKTVIVG